MKKRSEATQTLRAGCSKADPQTNTQTDRGDYNALRSLARSVKMKIQLHPSEGGYVFTRVRSFVCLFVRITLKLLTGYHKKIGGKVAHGPRQKTVLVLITLR